MSFYKFEIVAQNFTCPDFHTCTLMHSLADCQQKVSAGMQAVCQAVSTNLTEFLAKSCGRRGLSTCFEPTGNTLPGRDMAMAIVHNETQEKVYNFVTGNLTWTAVATLGTVALGFTAYKLIKKMSTPPEFFYKADNDRLSQLGILLDHADVSVGHLNGSQIKFTNINDKATFRQVSNRIEQLYSKEVEVMREKQKTYEWSQSETKPQGIGAAKLLSIPFMLVEAAAKTFYTDRPRLTVDETAKVREAIEWRKSAYSLLDNLYKKSQDKLDADTSYTGKLARVWDKALNKVSTWRKTPILRDIELLNQMGTNAPAPKIEILTGLKIASKAYENGNRFTSRALFGKEAIINVARIVRDIALTVFNACLIFSRNWKDNIISSFQDVRNDFNDLGTATIGIFSPSRAAISI